MPKPRDRRDFVFISVDLPDNPKLATIDDPRAGWLTVTGICYAGANLTDGHIPPRAVERKAGVPARWTKALIEAGIWHAPGHRCPDCPQPKSGNVYIHNYLDHQPSRADREKARRDAASAAAARWAKRGGSDAEGIPERNAEGIPKGSALTDAESLQSQSQSQERLTKPLLALVCRRLSGGARETTTDGEIDAWRELAGGADLEDELRKWLLYSANNDLKNPPAALRAWLQKAALREADRHAAATVDPDADIRPPTSDCENPACAGGYLGEDEDCRPIPCPNCRPHLRPLEAS